MRCATTSRKGTTELILSHLVQESGARHIAQRRGAPLCGGDVSFLERHAAELLPHGRRLATTNKHPDYTRYAVATEGARKGLAKHKYTTSYSCTNSFDELVKGKRCFLAKTINRLRSGPNADDNNTKKRAWN